MIPRPKKPKFNLLGWMSFSLRIWLLVTRSMSRAGLAGRAKEGLSSRVEVQHYLHDYIQELLMSNLSSRLETAALDFFMVGVCIGLSDLPSPSLSIETSKRNSKTKKSNFQHV